MMLLMKDWCKVVDVAQYRGSPFSLKLEFSQMSSMLRISVGYGELGATTYIGPIICNGDIPAQGLAQAIADGQLRFNAPTESLISNAVQDLMLNLNNELTTCQVH